MSIIFKTATPTRKSKTIIPQISLILIEAFLDLVIISFRQVDGNAKFLIVFLPFKLSRECKSPLVDT